MSHSAARFLGIGLILATVALFLIAGCGQPVKKSDAPVAANSPSFVAPDGSTSIRVTPVGAEYAGNEACSHCHASEFKDHKNSGHNLTMHFLDKEGMGDTAPPAGKIAASSYAVEKDEGKFYFSSTTHPEAEGVLNVSMGSGNTGITYLDLEPDFLAEAQMSYFPKLKKWYVTPGHQSNPGPNLGTVYKGETAQKCVFCHSTKMEADTLIPERKFVGVGCEACHGPGSLHITAMKAGNFSEGKMLKLESVGAGRVLRVCQQCHKPKPGSTMNTSRQTLVGLLKSECYLQGKDTLSCITCHNPHTNVSRDLKAYEKVCLNCHSSVATPVFKAGVTVQGKICPVNAKVQCIKCHMPPGAAFENSSTPTKFADHYIRVHKEKIPNSKATNIL